MATATRVPKRELGVTGEQVSIVGLGGFHLGIPGEADAVRIIHAALDAGVTFMDNSWDYHDGRSEERMGRALERRRDEAFLMTKVDGHTRAAARAQLEDSLRRLRTDRIDLWQFHEIIRFEDAEDLFRLGGIQAAVEARARGEVRYIGFTGHKDPEIHLHLLEVAAREGFHFDTVQMPLNVMDAHYRSFRERVLPVAQEHEVGVIGMKPMGSGDILESGAVEAAECLRFALSLPVSVVVTGCESMDRLEQAVEVASTFTPMSGAEMRELLMRTDESGADGRFEPYKTTNTHDGTARHPEWLGV